MQLLYRAIKQYMRILNTEIFGPEVELLGTYVYKFLSIYVISRAYKKLDMVVESLEKNRSRVTRRGEGSHTICSLKCCTM